jgi:hypothetical protein
MPRQDDLRRGFFSSPISGLAEKGGHPGRHAYRVAQATSRGAGGTPAANTRNTNSGKQHPAHATAVPAVPRETASLIQHMRRAGSDPEYMPPCRQRSMRSRPHFRIGRRFGLAALDAATTECEDRPLAVATQGVRSARDIPGYRNGAFTCCITNKRTRLVRASNIGPLMSAPA